MIQLPNRYFYARPDMPKRLLVIKIRTPLFFRHNPNRVLKIIQIISLISRENVKSVYHRLNILVIGSYQVTEPVISIRMYPVYGN